MTEWFFRASMMIDNRIARMVIQPFGINSNSQLGTEEDNHATDHCRHN